MKKMHCYSYFDKIALDLKQSKLTENGKNYCWIAPNQN